MKSKQVEGKKEWKYNTEANLITCFFKGSGGGRNNFAAFVSID
jgi:hypothetical protein